MLPAPGHTRFADFAARDLERFDPPLPGGMLYLRRHRVVDALLQTGRQSQDFFSAPIVVGPDDFKPPVAPGHCAGFIQHHRVDFLRLIEGLKILNQNALPGRQGDRRHARQGNGNAQGAGTGYHQDGQRPHKGLVRRGAAQVDPGARGRGQQAD